MMRFQPGHRVVNAVEQAFSNTFVALEVGTLQSPPPHRRERPLHMRPLIVPGQSEAAIVETLHLAEVVEERRRRITAEPVVSSVVVQEEGS
jgi:hypothetical protein